MAHKKLQQSEAALLPWSKIAAPIFVPSQKRHVGAHAVGTGFVIGSGGSLYFVTAAHALDEFVTGQTFATIFECAIEIEANSFKTCDQSDIAICDITSSITSLPEDALVPCFDRLASPPKANAYIIMGYPESRNRIGGYESLDRRCFRVSATRIASRVPPACRVKSPIVLSYEGVGGYMQGDKHKISLPDVHGMSGGPVLALISGEQMHEGRFVLAGVIVEQYPQPRCFIASDVSNVFDLIEMAKAQVSAESIRSY